MQKLWVIVLCPSNFFSTIHTLRALCLIFNDGVLQNLRHNSDSIIQKTKNHQRPLEIFDEKLATVKNFGYLENSLSNKSLLIKYNA